MLLQLPIREVIRLALDRLLVDAVDHLESALVGQAITDLNPFVGIVPQLHRIECLVSRIAVTRRFSHAFDGDGGRPEGRDSRRYCRKLRLARVGGDVRGLNVVHVLTRITHVVAAKHHDLDRFLGHGE